MLNNELEQTLTLLHGAWSTEIEPSRQKLYTSSTHTGKTESVKDLGKALAYPVVVFNCSKGLDYKMMTKFFSGLAQAGVWACFDEFNRIDIEVLSVIAQQIMTICDALKQNKDRFDFFGKEIRLNRNYGCYITMNPGAEQGWWPLHGYRQQASMNPRADPKFDWKNVGI